MPIEVFMDGMILYGNLYLKYRFNKVGNLLLIELLLKLGYGYVDFTILVFVLLCMFKNGFIFKALFI